MGLLALDITSTGVVMSADSQAVELRDGQIDVLAMPGQRSKKHIVVRTAIDFTGVIGYVGTETLEGIDTRAWLERYSTERPDEELAEFCEGLGAALSSVWSTAKLDIVLWIFVAGVVNGDPRFWHINNTTGLHDDWTYKAPTAEFSVVNDLDLNYVARDLAPGQSKDDLLATRMYSFRNGALVPGAFVFDGSPGRFAPCRAACRRARAAASRRPRPASPSRPRARKATRPRPTTRATTR